MKIVDNKTNPGTTTDFRKVNGYFSLGEKINYVVNGFVEDTRGKIKVSGAIETGTNNYKIHFHGKHLDAVKFNPYYRQYFNYPVETGMVTDISLALTGKNNTYRNKGDINFKDLNFIYFEGQKSVHAAKGRIAFTSSPKIVVLEDISGVVDECSSFKVSGKVWPAVEGRDKYELLIDLKNLDYFLGKNRYIHQEGLKKDLNIKGNGDLVFRLSVEGDNFKYAGRTDLKNVELDWGKVFYKPKDKICDLIFDINYRKDQKVWGDFSVVSRSLAVEGNGEVSDLECPEPKLDLNISLKEGYVGELLAFLPPWPKEIKLFGVTDRVNVRIFNERPSKTIYSVSVNGTPLAWQYAELFNKPYGMESKIDFNLVSEKGKLLLMDSRLTFGESEVESKVIEIDLKGGNGLNTELDFKKLVYDDVRKISDLFKEENIELDGYCGAKFILNSANSEVSLKGSADIFESKLIYDNFIDKNKGIPGRVEFNISWCGNTFVIDELRLESGKNKCLLNGEIVDYDKAQPQYGLMVISDSFYWGELTPAYMPGFEDYKLSGKSNVKLNISSRGKFLNIKGGLNLSECEARWKDRLSKPKGINHMVDFDFLFGEDNLIVNNVNISLGNFEIGGSGKLENYDMENPELVLGWEVNNFNGSELVNYLPSFGWLNDIKIEGLLKGGTSICKEGDVQKIRGELSLDNIDLFYKNRVYRANGVSDKIVWLVNEGEEVVYIDSGQWTVDQSVFKIKGNIKKQDDNLCVFLDVNCDELFLKEIIPYFSTKMAGELEGLNIDGAGKMNLRLENCGEIFTCKGDIDLRDNYISYKKIIAKPKGLDSRVVFKIINQKDSVNVDTLRFAWNNSSLDFYGKMDKIDTEPVLDLKLTGEIFYPELKMILADTPESRDIIKKFFALKDKNGKINLSLKITGKVENPEIKSDWGLIAAVVIKIGLQNSIEFLENAAGKTLETTLNFGKKTIETTVLVSGKVLRETVRAGINVIEGVYKIIWPFKKK
ncbi:MAG: DUF748 domain-containing protein [bacterium]